MRRTIGWLACSAVVAAGSTMLAPRVASACGGFFCSGSVPMDQAGENIVFGVNDDGTVETHVQILYSGEAEQFAWILPVPSVPELALGTDALFTQLGIVTAPRFETRYETEGTCRPEPYCRFPDSCFPPQFPTDASSARDSASPPPPDVMVLVEQTVGAFDAVVLTATDAMVLHAWLDEHDYDLPVASIPLLQAYVDLGDYFVALRLHANSGVGEIQPIVLRYAEPEPCIPIRLTAIATVPDLPITAYVLADTLATPLNYSFVDPPEDPGLWLGSASYVDLVTRAVDEAGGRAFVTEFAGDTPSIAIALPSIDHLRDAASPVELVRGIASELSADRQLLAVLTRAVPPPPGADPTRYFNCLVAGFPCDDSSWLTYVADGWSASMAVDVIAEAIVVPRMNAEALLARHPRLTRFFTTMSADEMTVDPVFRLDDGMADVSNVRVARHVTECSPEYFQFGAPQRLELPSGRVERISEGRRETRDDEAVCNERGGTTGTPEEPDCDAGSSTRDAGSSTTRDGGTSRMDAASTDGRHDAIKTSGGGGCSVARSERASSHSLLVALGLMVSLAACLRSRRKRRPE